ncbi:hypothetical protein BDU57DRAFT_565256, partial [Ampelomyces quisqualis]
NERWPRLIEVLQIIYSFETAAAYIVGGWWRGLANNGLTDKQRAALVPGSEEFHLRVGGSKTQLVGWSLYTLLLWTLKLSMCHFYSRLTSGLYLLGLRVKLGYVLIGATYLATAMSILLSCRPFYKNWQINPDPGNHCQPAVSRVDLLVTVVLNVLTDMYLISIPLPMLWNANLRIQNKISLMLIFSGGLLAMAAGILRCILIIQDPIGGAQAAGSWAIRETFVAVVIGNLPMIYPFARQGIERFYTVCTTSRTSQKSTSNKNVDFERSSRGRMRSLYELPTWNDDDAEFEQLSSRSTSRTRANNRHGTGITKTEEIEVKIAEGGPLEETNMFE